MSASKKFPIPLSYFSIALGLFALGLSWRYGASVGLLPALAAESLLAAASVVWLLLVAAYLIKIFAYRNDFLSDLRDLVQCCFISAIPITAMLEGLALKPYQAGAAAVLIYAGVAGQLAFSMYRAAGLWRGLHSLEATTPIIYLPTVATNFVSASSLAALGHHDYAALFFGAGMFSWLSLEASILGRLRTAAPVGTTARGVVGIQLAPAFVGCGAYFAVGGKIDGFALALIGYGCLQLLFLLRLTRWFWEDQIAPAILSGKRVLVAAHGNSLRALAKHIEGISDEDIMGLEIPTGQPLVYKLDDNLKVIEKFYL